MRRSCVHHTARLPVAASALLDLTGPGAAPRAAAQSLVGSWQAAGACWRPCTAYGAHNTLA